VPHCAGGKSIIRRTTRYVNVTLVIAVALGRLFAEALRSTMKPSQFDKKPVRGCTVK
jgi:hypothetical protein